MSGSTSVHATAIVVGETGVLIEGASGSGKSALALAILASRPRLARLVGDDRVLLQAAGGRLLARPHPRIAGLIERRGHGLLRVEHEPACVIGLVILRADHPERMPGAAPTAERLGLRLPLCRVPPAAGPAEAAAITLATLCFVNASGCFEMLQPACQARLDLEDWQERRGGADTGAAST